MLEKQNLFNSEKLTEIIIKEFVLHGEKILGAIVKAQSSKKIHKVFKFDLVKSFSTKLKPVLYKNILKDKDKLNAKINNLIEKFINSKSNEIFNKDLSKLLTYDQMPNLTNEFAKSISELFRKNAPIYKTKVEDLLSLKARNVNLLSTLENSKEDILDLIVDNLMVVHKETVDKYKDYELGEFISLYFDKTKLSAILINEAYPKLIDNLDFILDDTKDYLVNKIIETGLDSISYYIVPILQEINLKNITNKQIELLNPKEIDVLFNSFAGDFFNKLRIYGVFGFVFGINVGLSIILWALDLRYNKISSKDR